MGWNRVVVLYDAIGGGAIGWNRGVAPEGAIGWWR